MDLDPDDVFVDEGCVLDVGRFVEVTSNTFYDEGVDLICRAEVVVDRIAPPVPASDN